MSTKPVIADMQCKTYGTAHGLWQYDYGQILRIQGLNLPTAVEIHFSLRETGGESVTRVGVTRDGVTDVVIPDSMLENGNITSDYYIYAFIYMTNESSGETTHKIRMKVQTRPRPEAFDTPEDAELFRGAIAAVNEAADRAGVSEENAAVSEQKTEEHLEAVDVLAKQVAENTAKVEELTQKTEMYAGAVKRGVQADMSVNDENDPAYVKNRTHWIDGEVIHKLPEVFLPESVVTQIEKNKNDISKLSGEIANFTVEGEVPINICNELYEYGRFATDGSYTDNGYNFCFRTSSYLKANGGKTIIAFFGQNNFNGSSAVQLVQYNANKEVIGTRTDFYVKKYNGKITGDAQQPKELTLNDETAYVRFSVCPWSDVGTLENLEVGLYYVEDNVEDYLPYSETKPATFLNAEKIKGLSMGSRKLLSNIDSMTTSDLAVGDVIETLGYYEDGDGGGAVYTVVSTLDSTTHQIPLGNGFYASLVHNGVINVKQLGARGDNLTDDSSAFQKAFDLATISVTIPKGDYVIKSSIVIQNKVHFVIHAEESTIRFDEINAYCFKFTNVHFTDVHFGRVIGRNSNGCVELYSESNDTAVTYLNIYFRTFASDTNCVYAHCGGEDTQGGYICEIRFFNGNVKAYTSANYGVGFKIDNTKVNTMDHYVFSNIGIEGIHTGFHFIGVEEQPETETALGGKGYVEACEFFGCRSMEAFTLILKTEGMVRNCQYITTSYIYSHLFDVSEQTYGFKFLCPIMNKDGLRIAYSMLIHNGVLIPSIEDARTYKNITSLGEEYDLNTVEDSFDRACKYFLVNSGNKALKLTNQYGGKSRLNRFYLKMSGIHPNGFTVYDYEGNVIFNNTSNLQAPCLLSFEWIEDAGWIITKVDTIA